MAEKLLEWGGRGRNFTVGGGFARNFTGIVEAVKLLENLSIPRNILGRLLLSRNLLQHGGQNRTLHIYMPSTFHHVVEMH